MQPTKETQQQKNQRKRESIELKNKAIIENSIKV